MGKIKIYNLIDQMINLNIIGDDGKEKTVPLPSKGCISLPEEKITPEINNLSKRGYIKVEFPTPEKLTSSAGQPLTFSGRKKK